MDYGTANAEDGAEECQDELAVEERSMGNGAADADGAQARGAERVSAAQGAQEVERNDSVDSGDIAGVGARDSGTEAGHGAAMEDVSMDYGTANAEESAEEYQDELTAEESRDQWA